MTTTTTGGSRSSFPDHKVSSITDEEKCMASSPSSLSTTTGEIFEIPQLQQQTQGSSGPPACASDKKKFFDCLKVNHQGDNQQACSFLYDALKTCQMNSRTQISSSSFQ